MSMNQSAYHPSIRRLVETAVMLAIANVLSELSFQGPWPLGGSITIASTLPLVLITWRWGTKWGLFSAFVHGLLQMVLGFSNVQYAQNAFQVIVIVVLDYLIAFSVIGLSGFFRHAFQKQLTAIIAGIVLSAALTFATFFQATWSGKPYGQRVG